MVFGIVIFDLVVEWFEQGEVIVVGSGWLLQDGLQCLLQFQVGDQVFFGKYVGQIVKVNGEELFVMCEEDVMGVFEFELLVVRKVV